MRVISVEIKLESVAGTGRTRIIHQIKELLQREGWKISNEHSVNRKDHHQGFTIEREDFLP